MNTKLVALAALALVACSSPAEGPSEASDASTDAGGAIPAQDAGNDATPPDAATIVKTYGQGRVTVDSNGFTYDTKLQDPCTFEKATDAEIRCLPMTQGVAFAGYLSQDCTSPIFSAPVGTPSALFVLDGGAVCSSSTPVSATSYFTKTGDTPFACDKAETAAPGSYFRCDTVEAPSQFVAQSQADQ